MPLNKEIIPNQIVKASTNGGGKITSYIFLIFILLLSQVYFSLVQSHKCELPGENQTHSSNDR